MKLKFTRYQLDQVILVQYRLKENYSHGVSMLMDNWVLEIKSQDGNPTELKRIQQEIFYLKLQVWHVDTIPHLQSIALEISTLGEKDIQVTSIKQMKTFQEKLKSILRTESLQVYIAIETLQQHSPLFEFIQSLQIVDHKVEEH